MLGPALEDNGFDLETSPAGRIERWTETGHGRSFFMYWIVNPFGDRADDKTGTVAYLESDMPLPLRRHLIVITQYLGLKTFDNIYGEQMTLPHLKVIGAAGTNGMFYIDGAWTSVDGSVEFYFDDRSIAALEKRLKPLAGAGVAAAEPKPDVAALPAVGPKPVAAPPSRSKDCATLTKILASRDDIAARHGEEKATRVMAAAKKRFEEYECGK